MGAGRRAKETRLLASRLLFSFLLFSLLNNFLSSHLCSFNPTNATDYSLATYTTRFLVRPLSLPLPFPSSSPISHLLTLSPLIHLQRSPPPTVPPPSPPMPPSLCPMESLPILPPLLPFLGVRFYSPSHLPFSLSSLLQLSDPPPPLPFPPFHRTRNPRFPLLRNQPLQQHRYLLRLRCFFHPRRRFLNRRGRLFLLHRRCCC